MNLPPSSHSQSLINQSHFVLCVLLLTSLGTGEQGEEREVVFVGSGTGGLAANEGSLNGSIVLLFI